VLGGQDRRYVSFNGTSSTVVKNQRVVLDWQGTWVANAQHQITGGLTAEANHTRNTGFGNINERQQLLALFVQDQWTPVEHVYLTAGLRNDDFDTFGRATTGRATAAWLSADSRWKLRSSYGTAFRSPSFLDLYGQDPYYVGNPNLKPEKARAGMRAWIISSRTRRVCSARPGSIRASRTSWPTTSRSSQGQ